MKKLPAFRRKRLLSAVKQYRKKYLMGKYPKVNEEDTRLMVNEFLTRVLEYVLLDEVRTESMIRGGFADYVIKIREKSYFVIEVKKMEIALSEEHLRQARHYASDAGIGYVLLTNGRQYEFYRILRPKSPKPIESRRIFSLDLANEASLKRTVDYLQYITRRMVQKRGLEILWHKYCALDPSNISSLFYSDRIINFIRRQLKKTHRTSFDREDVVAAITRVIEDKIENINPSKRRRRKSRQKAGSHPNKKPQAVSSATPAESIVSQE